MTYGDSLSVIDLHLFEAPAPQSTACAITEARQFLPSFAGSPLQPQMEHLARDSVYEIGSIRAMSFTEFYAE